MPTLYDVFISHSHKDEWRAKALAAKLRNWDVSAYVDFGDETLCSLPNEELAERLVSKLRQCRLLIFAFSEESVGSRWMPWELGLAHGVIGRVVLWPFSKRALQAKEVQEYLTLYEALDPTTAEMRLRSLLVSARQDSIRPADIRMMEDLANITVAKAPQFNNPAVATEFIAQGPFQLYSAWLNALVNPWQKK